MAYDLPWDKEGYVVCDKNFNRLKVKSPQYILAHYARNNNVITEERLMEVVLRGEIEEFSCYASEYLPKLQELQKKNLLYKQRLNSFVLFSSPSSILPPERSSPLP